MKLLSLSFLTVLVLAHWTGDPARLLGLPLSMFRDGPLQIFGYLLFTLLMAVAGLMVATALRKNLPEYAVFFGVAALILLLVAVTPSQDYFHLFCSLVL